MNASLTESSLVLFLCAQTLIVLPAPSPPPLGPAVQQIELRTPNTTIQGLSLRLKLSIVPFWSLSEVKTCFCEN